MESVTGKVSISFIDLEVQPSTGTIVDLGAVRYNNGVGYNLKEFHSSHLNDFINFISGCDFICRHNIFKHDLVYLKKVIPEILPDSCNIIDTLLLSPLLFPSRPYHKLVKDDKLHSDDEKNRLNWLIVLR